MWEGRAEVKARDWDKKSKEDKEDEDVGHPPELEKIFAHEDQEMGPHQEETELVDLGTESGKKGSKDRHVYDRTHP